MSLQITDEQLDAETQRQIPILSEMIAKQLHGHERTALDFGCGAGRFTQMLAKCVHGRAVGFDPCADLIALSTGAYDVDYFTGSSESFFHECRTNEVTYDVVFAAQVLGSPELDLGATAAGLVDVVADGGLLVIVDHMPTEIPAGRWWQFRPVKIYVDLFGRNGMAMKDVGSLMQLENQITMLCGRKA